MWWVKVQPEISIEEKDWSSNGISYSDTITPEAVGIV